MELQLQGRKRGMTQVFDDEGNVQPCTVIELEKNVISQIKTKESDGYNAIQLGFELVECKDPRTVEKRLGKPRVGHFQKNNIKPRRFLAESRVKDSAPYQVAQEFGVEQFQVGDFVDVSGTSKGKGYQGVMKLHGFKGYPGSHGVGPVARHAGSTGQRSTPGRCFPNGKRASRMGTDAITTQNLKVIAIDEQKQILVVKGAVAGARNGLVKVALSVKKGRK
jgi:large subunit ribosomal protein L3